MTSQLGPVNFTRRSDGWDAGGSFAPGSNSAASVTGGADWQRGQQGYNVAFAPGSNKMGPMQTQHRVVWPYALHWYRGVGEDWHKYICHHLCFDVFDKGNNLEKSFAAKYGIQTTNGRVWKRPDPTKPKDMYDLETVDGPWRTGDLTHVLTIVYLNYLLLSEFFSNVKLTTTQVTDLIRPLGIFHTQADTDDVDGKGFPMFNAPTDVQNATIAGPVNCFNLWKAGKQGDQLYVLLVARRYQPDERFMFNFNPEVQGEQEYFAPDSRKAPNELPAYYWEMVPWCGDCEPSLEDIKLTIEGIDIIGHYWRVGRYDYESWMGKDKTNGLLAGLMLPNDYDIRRSMRKIQMQGQLYVFVDLNTQLPAL